MSDDWQRTPKGRQFGLSANGPLYLEPCGDGRFSTVGFDYAERQRAKIAAWLTQEARDWPGRGTVPSYQAPAPAPAPGTPEHYDAYCDALEAGAALHKATGRRCQSDLLSPLCGREGCRVEVRAPDGTRRRFIVGRSTGWLPCHIELHNVRSRSGPPAYLPLGATVTVIRRER